jgi:DNA-binding transcriptional LysR family regulator
MLTGDYVPPRKPRLTPSPDQRDIVKVQAPDRQTGADTAPVKAPGQLQTAPHETSPADHTAGETCGLESRGLKRRIVLTVPNFMMALAHLANSDLIAALPRRLVQQYGGRMGLTFAELPFKRQTDPIQAIATKAALMDAGVAWLMEVFTRLFATGRPNSR